MSAPKPIRINTCHAQERTLKAGRIEIWRSPGYLWIGQDTGAFVGVVDRVDSLKRLRRMVTALIRQKQRKTRRLAYSLERTGQTG